MALIRYSDFVDYFARMCNANALVQHMRAPANLKKFYFTIDDFINTSIQDTSVILVPEEFYYENAENNKFHFRNFSLWILDTVRTGDFTSEKTAYDNCELIAEQFISYMENDYVQMRNGNVATAPFHYWQRGDCRMELIGPVHDNKYGVQLHIKIGIAKNLCYQMVEWLTPTI